MNDQVNFKLRENNPHDNPDYKYELDIDTNNVDLMSQIIDSTSLVETDNETGVTLYANDKQVLLAEKERIEQQFMNQKGKQVMSNAINNQISNFIASQRYYIGTVTVADLDTQAFLKLHGQSYPLDSDLRATKYIALVDVNDQILLREPYDQPEKFYQELRNYVEKLLKA